MPKPAYAKIIGIGLHSSIGTDAASSLDALRNQAPSFKSERLDQFIDPMQAALLPAAKGRPLARREPLADEKPLADEEREPSAQAKPSAETENALNTLKSLLDSAVNQALDGAQLSNQQRAEMPVYIGSSSYGIGIAEEYYSAQLNTGKSNSTVEQSAMALPLDGFGQISSHLQQAHGLYGADFCYNTACTASANALLTASQGIRAGLHKYALVIGIELKNLTTLAGFASMQLLANAAMQPFDKHRNGLVLAEGCAAILLSAAEDNAGLTLSGGASLSDTYSIAASNPDGSEIAKAMQQALHDSNVSVNDIIAIKAHGTATPLNDKGEAAALHRLFPTVPPLACLKPHLGHTLGGCGAIELALFATGLQCGILTTSRATTEPDPALNIQPLDTCGAAPDGFYMLNYFGFGGNNCSLILHSRQS